MRTTSPVVGASAALVVGCALSLGAALAHAAPTKPVAVAADAGATPLRLQTLKDIGAEEVAIKALTTQVADLESTRTEVARRRTRLISLTTPVLSLLGQPHTQAEEELVKLLRDRLAAAGIGLDGQAVADLANALSQGGSGATAVAFMLCTAIAEASAIRDPDAGAPPLSRHADTIKRLARAAANHATLTPATVAPMLDAMLATPGVVPVARMDLVAAAKVTGPGTGQNFLGVLTRSYDSYVTKIGTSIDGAKQDMALRQGRVAVHKERLRTLPTP